MPGRLQCRASSSILHRVSGVHSVSALCASSSASLRMTCVVAATSASITIWQQKETQCLPGLGAIATHRLQSALSVLPHLCGHRLLACPLCVCCPTLSVRALTKPRLVSMQWLVAPLPTHRSGCVGPVSRNALLWLQTLTLCGVIPVCEMPPL